MKKTVTATLLIPLSAAAFLPFSCLPVVLLTSVSSAPGKCDLPAVRSRSCSEGRLEDSHRPAPQKGDPASVIMLTEPRNIGMVACAVRGQPLCGWEDMVQPEREEDIHIAFPQAQDGCNSVLAVAVCLSACLSTLSDAGIW